MRNRHDAGQGQPWTHNPFGLWGLGFSLSLFQSCLDEHFIELTQDFLFVALKVKLSFDYAVSTFATAFQAFSFELELGGEHKEPVRGDCFGSIEGHIIGACEC